MKSIDTLVDDIKNVFTSRPDVSPDDVEAFGQEVASIVRDRILEEPRAPTLRLSNLGTICKRKLWFDVNTPEIGDPLTPDARIKFLFGDILEAMLLFLAKVAGHEVKDRQKEVTLYGVKGHIDGTVDAVLVDVKSASSYSFNKFREGLSEATDSFGYRTQLDAYMHASGNVDGAFLAIDKQLGHITLDSHKKSDKNYKEIVDDTRRILETRTPPERGYNDIPEGKSGNRKLGVECSYCPYKFHCWPNLRVFHYSRGPVYLTKVLREPKVDEA